MNKSFNRTLIFCFFVLKKSQENGNIPNMYGDRFIPRRYNGFQLDFPKDHHKIMSSDFLQLVSNYQLFKIRFF